MRNRKLNQSVVIAMAVVFLLSITVMMSLSQAPAAAAGLLQLERRLRARLPQAVVVDVAALADVVVRVAPLLLLNLLHDLRMEP